MYVFSGTNRRTARLLVEGNETMTLGAPIRLPISSGATVVLQVEN